LLFTILNMATQLADGYLYTIKYQGFMLTT
jgi:hypothetical protein